jgi:hypothetical protein
MRLPYKIQQHDVAFDDGSIKKSGISRLSGDGGVGVIICIIIILILSVVDS